MKTPNVNTIYKHDGFRSTKNLRKESIDDSRYRKQAESNANQKIIGIYLNWTYLIHWKKNGGITCSIFDNDGKFIAYTGYGYYYEASKLEIRAKRYIEVMQKRLYDKIINSL